MPKPKRTHVQVKFGRYPPGKRKLQMVAGATVFVDRYPVSNIHHRAAYLAMLKLGLDPRGLYGFTRAKGGLGFANWMQMPEVVKHKRTVYK